VKVAGRLSALATITSLAELPENQPLIWCKTSPSARANLVAAAEVTDASYNAFRAVGTQGLANLAQCQMNKLPIWEDERVRQAFISAAKMHAQYGLDAEEANQWKNCGILHAVRQSGMAGLSSLASGSGDLQRRMWLDRDGAVEALLVGGKLRTACSQDSEAKADAMSAFASLASCGKNREAMWRDISVRNTLMTVAQENDRKNQEARSFAMGALQELADATGNQPEMWGGVTANAVARRRRSRRRTIVRRLDETDEADDPTWTT